MNREALPDEEEQFRSIAEIIEAQNEAIAAATS